jgi:hypothetical protein
LNIESQYFPQLIAAILEFSKLEVPKSNVEAIFEYSRDPETGIASVCIVTSLVAVTVLTGP